MSHPIIPPEQWEQMNQITGLNKPYPKEWTTQSAARPASEAGRYFKELVHAGRVSVTPEQWAAAEEKWNAKAASSSDDLYKIPFEDVAEMDRITGYNKSGLFPYVIPKPKSGSAEKKPAAAATHNGTDDDTEIPVKYQPRFVGTGEFERDTPFALGNGHTTDERLLSTPEVQDLTASGYSTNEALIEGTRQMLHPDRNMLGALPNRNYRVPEVDPTVSYDKQKPIVTLGGEVLTGEEPGIEQRIEARMGQERERAGQMVREEQERRALIEKKEAAQERGRQRRQDVLSKVDEGAKRQNLLFQGWANYGKGQMLRSPDLLEGDAAHAAIYAQRQLNASNIKDKQDKAEGDTSSGLLGALFNSSTFQDVFGWSKNFEKKLLNRALDKSEGGEPLTPDEKDIIEIHRLGLELQKSIEARGGLTTSAHIGQNIAESLPFLRDFAVTGGLGGAVGKAAVGGLMRTAGGKYLKKAAQKGLEYAISSAVMTPLQSGTYENYLDRTINQYRFAEDGSIEKFATPAFARTYKAFAESFNEVFSEHIGAGLGKGMGWMLKTPARKISKVLGHEIAFDMTFGGYKRNFIMDFLRNRLGWQGTFQEFLEEVYTGITTPLLTGETERMKDFWVDGNWWKTFLTVGTMGAGFMVLDTPAAVGYGAQIHKYRRIERNSLASIDNPELRGMIYNASHKPTLWEQSDAFSKIDWKSLNLSLKDAAHIGDYLLARAAKNMFKETGRAMDATGQFYKELENNVYSKLYCGVDGTQPTRQMVLCRTNEGGPYAVLSGDYEGKSPNNMLIVSDEAGEKKTIPLSSVTSFEARNADDYLSMRFAEITQSGLSGQQLEDAEEEVQTASEAGIDTQEAASVIAQDIGAYEPGAEVQLTDGRKVTVTERFPDGYEVEDEDGSSYIVAPEDIAYDKADMAEETLRIDRFRPQEEATDTTEGGQSELHGGSTAEAVLSPDVQVPAAEGVTDNAPVSAESIIEEGPETLPENIPTEAGPQQAGIDTESEPQTGTPLPGGEPQSSGTQWEELPEVPTTKDGTPDFTRMSPIMLGNQMEKLLGSRTKAYEALRGMVEDNSRQIEKLQAKIPTNSGAFNAYAKKIAGLRREAERLGFAMERYSDLAAPVPQTGDPASSVSENAGAGSDRSLESIGVQNSIALPQNPAFLNNENAEVLPESKSLIEQMRANAEIAPSLELTPESWEKEFGDRGIVITPIGEVKMGDNQYLKLLKTKREQQFGMIRPTLERPDLIIEQASPRENVERESEYLFVKCFTRADNSKQINFESVTVSKDGKEVVISNHIIRDSQLKNKIEEGNLLWNRFGFDSNSSGENQVLSSPATQDPNSIGPGSNTQSSVPSSAFKDTKFLPENPEEGKRSSRNESAKTYLPESALRPQNTTKSTHSMGLESLGDHVSVDDVILRDIAAGNVKFIWKDKGVRRGLATELGFVDRPGEQQNRLGLLSNAGFAPEEYAEHLYHTYGRGNEGGIGVSWNLDDTEIKNRVLDILMTVTNQKIATERAIELHKEYNPYEGWDEEDFAKQEAYDQQERERRSQKEVLGKLSHTVPVIEESYVPTVEEMEEYERNFISLENGRKEQDTAYYDGEYASIYNDSFVDSFAGVPVQHEGSVHDGMVYPFDWRPEKVLGRNSGIAEKEVGVHGDSFSGGMEYVYPGTTMEGVGTAGRKPVSTGQRMVRQGHHENGKGSVPETEHTPEGSLGVNVGSFGEGTAGGTGAGNGSIPSVVRERDGQGERHGAEREVAERTEQSAPDIIFREAEDSQAINFRFNEELDRQIAGELPEGHVYHLGRPSDALLSAGIPDLPIELRAERLRKKSTVDTHPFDLSDIRDLPQAIAEPIAVFQSKVDSSAKVILTELSNGNNNYVVALWVVNRPVSGRRVLEVNEVRSLYPKDARSVLFWITEDRLLKWVDKKKAADWLVKQQPVLSVESEKEITVTGLGKRRSHSADVAIPDNGDIDAGAANNKRSSESNEVSAEAARGQETSGSVSTQWPNYIGGGNTTESLISATKIIQNFENPSIGEGKIVSAAETLATELNTSLEFVREVGEISDSDGLRQKRKRRSKGWYEPSTGKVVIVIPNNTDVSDVQATVLHEVVGHEGLRGALGDKFEGFLDKVYASLESAEKERIDRTVPDQDGADVQARRAVTEEYLAGLAERDVEPGVFARIIGRVRQILRDILHLPLRVSDPDIAYMLWKSKRRLQKGANPMQVVEHLVRDRELREKLHAGKDAVFRDAASESTFSPVFDAEQSEQMRLPEDDSQASALSAEMKELRKKVAALEKLKDKQLDRIKSKRMQTRQQAQERVDKYNALFSEAKRQIKESITPQLAKIMGKREFNSLLSSITDIRSVNALRKATDRITDVAADLNAGYEERQLERLLQLKADDQQWLEKFIKTHTISQAEAKKLLEDRYRGENARGVSVARMVDDGTRVLMEYVRDNIKSVLQTDAEGNSSLSAKRDELETKRALAEQGGGQLGPSDKARLVAVSLLEYYRDNVAAIGANIRELANQRKEAAEKLSDLRQSGADNAVIECQKEGVDAIESELRRNKADYADALNDFNAQIKELLMAGRLNLRESKERENRERDNLVQMVFEGASDKQVERMHVQDPTRWRKATNHLNNLFASHLYSLSFTLKTMDKNAPGGMGELYECIMTGEKGYVTAADNFYGGLRAFIEESNVMAARTFGKEHAKNCAIRLIRDTKKTLEGVTVEERTYGKPTVVNLTIGSALYIRALNKQASGAMTLRKMGISQADVDRITDALYEQAPKMVRFADWIQEEFLPSKREKYNEVHLKMFGTQMREEENYFPIRRRKSDVLKKVDGREEMRERLPSTLTGSIINRVPNNVALDISANFFEVFFEHGQQMEHWAAFTPAVKNINALLSNTAVRKLLSAGGRRTWERLKTSAEIASGQYLPKTNKLNDTLAVISKALAASKITLRLFTAIKQLASAPAFYGYSADPKFAAILTKHLVNPLAYREAWVWGMDNLPQMHERWHGRLGGDEKLAGNTATWLESGFKKIVKYGFTPNAFVDAVTCCIGAKAVYEYELQRGSKLYSAEEATRLAKAAATISFNETQQSAEGAYLSQLQKDRDLFSICASMFNNATFGYNRKMIEGIQELKRDPKKEIEYLTKRYIKRGIEPEAAAKQATRDVRMAKYTAGVRIGLFGAILQIYWNLFSKAWQYIWGDPEDKDILQDIQDGAIVGPFRGFVWGNVYESVYNDYDFEPVMLVGEIQKLIRNAKNNEENHYVNVANVTALLGLAFSAGFGINFETFERMYHGFEGMIRDGMDVEDWMNATNAPKLQTRLIAGRKREDETIDEYNQRVGFIYRATNKKYDPKRDNAYEQSRRRAAYRRMGIGRQVEQVNEQYRKILQECGLTIDGREKNNAPPEYKRLRGRLEDRVANIYSKDKSMNPKKADGYYYDRGLRRLHEQKQEVIRIYEENKL